MVEGPVFKDQSAQAGSFRKICLLTFQYDELPSQGIRKLQIAVLNLFDLLDGQ